MSDSDSDFAYESAGEDADVGDVDDLKTATLQDTKPTLIENVNSSEVQEVSSVTTDTNVAKELSRVVDDVASLNVDDKISSAKIDAPCISSNDPEITHPNNNVASKVEAEPKRVQLRLERKLMEKNQLSSVRKISPASSSDNVPSVPVTEPEDSSSNDAPCIAMAEQECLSSNDVPADEKPSSWGWSSWGTSLLSSAASSVTTFTSQVTQGIGTVIETVETTLSVPPPEELAVSLAQKDSTILSGEKSEVTEAAETNSSERKPSTGSNLFSGVTSLTRVLENTGTKVFMGGLDTLELIGKKTMDILTEGDPGLRNKRAALSEGMTLSQILRDAQSKAEETKSCEEDVLQEAVLYTKYFDEFQGLVHLEALEMLSKQCESKVQSMFSIVSGDTSKKYVLDMIKNICEDLPTLDDSYEEENQDFSKLCADHMNALHLSLNSQKLEDVHTHISEQIQRLREEQDEAKPILPKEIYHQAISCLAEFTAKCVEHFHKIGELILVQPNVQAAVMDCTTHLSGLTSVLCIETSSMASKFCDCLNAMSSSGDDDSVTSLITSVYLEASNSTTYTQDAFQLLIPVLQLATLQ